MKYLFDSSAIFRALKENKVEVLVGNSTLELARYELGNIIWKDYALQSRISEQEAKILVKAIKPTLSIMDVLEIKGYEEEILDVATQLKTTFYDSSYVCFAKARGLKLVTEDARLIKKTAGTLNASTLDSIK
jgi:predicted nucleic acid-binding protein